MPPANEHRELVAIRTAHAPDIDGRLDEQGWRTAPVATGFVDQKPIPGVAAAERTEARVLYDDEAIYVGLRMYDNDPARIATAVARRDYAGYSDWVDVIIDSYHDRRTAFRFGVNPSGVQRDALEYDDGRGEDYGWDAVWSAATRIDSLGWTAELRIPLSQLRFSTQGTAAVSHATRVPSGDVRRALWGIEFVRDVARLNERSYWAPVPPDASRFVSLFGDLAGLDGLRAPHRLELLPYSLTRLTQAPGNPSDPFFRRDRMAAKVGGDLKYGLPAGLTLTATLNPDFGQVEADPSVVNLTAFETFFPERRPFFLEGTDIFRFNIGFPYFVSGTGLGSDQPFYSRRLGRPPQGFVPNTAIYQDEPDATTILGAVKVSGKTANHWSIGMLDGVTNRTLARYADSTGRQFGIPVEPLTNYAVARAIRDFRQGQSAMGGIFTATNRQLGGAGLNKLLRSAAYTAGLDGRHRFAAGNYELTASLLATEVQGNQQAIALLQRSPTHYFQRPDAHYLHYDTTRTALSGAAASAEIAKLGGGHWRWSAAGHLRSPGLEMNDIGFQQTADWLIEGAQVGYVDYTPHRAVRDWQAYLSEFSGWDFGGERRTTGVSLNTTIDLLNNWGAYSTLTQQLRALSIDGLRGGPALVVPAYTELSAGLHGDQRRRLYPSVDVSADRESETGGDFLAVNPYLNLRASSRAELSIGPGASWATNPWQYVVQQPVQGQVHYIFGRLVLTTVSLTARGRYSFTPHLSLEFYGQPFVSAGSYADLKEVVNARAQRYRDRFRSFAPNQVTYDSATRQYTVNFGQDTRNSIALGDPNFNFRQFNSTAVLRWEYRPGSTVFAVWSQGRSSYDQLGTFNLDRDTQFLFHAPATNTFLIKVNYWLDL